MPTHTTQPPLVSKRGWRYAPISHTDEAEFSTNLARTLASLLDVQPDELDPLSRSIDPDILDGLFSKSSGGGEHVRALQFSYQDRLIQIETAPGSAFTVVGVEGEPSLDDAGQTVDLSGQTSAGVPQE